jgi:hypothetical protein
MTLITPNTFVSNCSLNSWIESSSKGPTRAYPALLTNTSIVPRSFTIFLIASLTHLSSVTSSLKTSKGNFSFCFN